MTAMMKMNLIKNKRELNKSIYKMFFITDYRAIATLARKYASIRKAVEED